MTMTAIGAVDIGGTKIAVGMVDDDGRVLSRQEAPTQTAGAWPQALDAHRRHAAQGGT